jgi:hypothetical protein
VPSNEVDYAEQRPAFCLSSKRCHEQTWDEIQVFKGPILGFHELFIFQKVRVTLSDAANERCSGLVGSPASKLASGSQLGDRPHSGRIITASFVDRYK